MSSPRTRLTVAIATAAATAGLVLGQGATPAMSAPVGAPATHPAVPNRSLDAGPHHLSVAPSAHPSLPAGVPHTGRYTFLVKLKTTSSLTTFNHTRSQGKSIQAAGKAASAQAATVAAAQKSLVAKLPAASTVLYRVHNVMAGVAVTTNVANYAKLAALPNVAAVYPVAPKTPSTSYAVPLQGGPQAWSDVPAGDGQAGQGVRIADIDTGLDYTHADFGGPGTTAAFDCAKHDDTESLTQVAADCGSSIYDPSKFDAADSYDLVGDSYDADPQDATYQPVPQPDDNPLDCDGHGTHTAGIAAGYGIQAGQTTAYSGPYDASTISTSTSSDWKIGPGMAPLATLIAFRVFGCSGSSDEVTHALDMAIDLNTDSNPNNDVNVINMSLGSDYAPADDGDAIAAQDAVAAGINVVVASGNDDDVPDIGGSPGDAPQVLTVAASGDAQEVDDATNFTVTGDTAGLDGAHTGASSRSIGYAWGKSGEQFGHGDMPASAPVVLLTDKSQDGTADACNDAKHPITQDLTGKIVVVPQWNDSSPECGSAVRGANIRAAGGIGFIFVSNRDYISAGINGDLGADGIPDNGTPNGGKNDTTNSNDAIPGVLMVQGTTSGTLTDGALLLKALQDGATVSVTGTQANADTHPDPTTLNNSLADFSSRGVHAAGDVKPDVAAVGLTVASAASGTGSDSVTESGTSMATPMVAGLAALLVGEHGDKTPDNPTGAFPAGSSSPVTTAGWTPEMVKADIMNTADQNAGEDLNVDGTADSPSYAPNRVGSGRIDADAALRNNVLAYNADDKGTVSVSFGPVAVPIDSTTPYTALKTIKVTNTGTTAETYNVAYNAVDSIPGVVYHLSTDGANGSSGSLTVAPGQTQRVVVTLEIDDPTKLTKAVDPSYWQRAGATDPYYPAGTVIDAAQDLAVETLADASGDVVLTPTSDTSIPTLRVPVYSAPRPASDLSIGGKVSLTSTGHGTLTPQGAGLAQGLHDTGTADTDPSNDIYSIGAGFEWQATSPALPRCSSTVTSYCIALDEDSGVDLKAVGSTSDYPQEGAKSGQVYFGVESYGSNSTPAGENEYDVSIDVDGDGVPDLVAYNTVLGYPDAAVPVYVVDIVDLRPGADQGAVIDTVPLDDRTGDTDAAVFDSDVEMLPVPISDLEAVGLKAGQPITYGITTYDDDSGAAVDEVGTSATGSVRGGLTMNPFKPAVEVTEGGLGGWVDDQPTIPLAVSVNKAQLATDHGLGLMFMHFHNTLGNKVDLASFGSQSLKVTGSGLTVGKKGTLSVSVTGGPVAATGTVMVKQGSRTLGTVNLAKAHTLSWTPKTAGRITLTASYTGDANYSPETDAATVSVVKAKPTITTKASTRTPKVGKAFTVKVQFKGVSGLRPTGRVTLKLGTRSEGSKAFSNGTATFTVRATKKGKQALAARFAGDGHYLAVSATSVSITAK